jgi:hypothetical protein
MAKWQNVALISTIVAPLAFGAAPLGEALAQSTRPTATDVQVHKMEKQTGTGTDGQNVLWGSGDVLDKGLLSSAGYEAVKSSDFAFTAVQLNAEATGTDGKADKSVITKLDSKTGAPIFSTDKDITLGGKTYSWADLLTASLATSTYTNNTEGGKTKPTVNDYTVSLTLPSGVSEADFIAAVKDMNSIATVTQSTDATTGTASFNDLANGQWLVFETSKAANIKEKSVPMFLNLPAQKVFPTDTTDKWYGNATAADALNLYPKNYMDSGDVTVEKADSETGKQVAGAWIGLFQNLTDTEADTALKTVASFDAKTTNSAAIITALTGAGIDKAKIIGVQETTDTGTKFGSLNPGQTYQVLELVEPEGYLINPTLKSFTLSDADDTSKDEDANDGWVHYQNGKFTLNNFEPGVKKQVQIGDTVSKDDTTQGVDRGQDFNWLINADLPKQADLITDTTTYQFTDSVPFQTNWTNMSVDIANMGELFTVMHNGWTGKGGDTGNMVTYDNQKDGQATYKDRTDGTVKEYTDKAETLKAGVTVSASDADYANLVATGATLPAGVTDATSWQDWVNTNVHIYGYSSYYEYVNNGRTTKNQENGKLQIDLTPAAQRLFAEIASKSTKATTANEGMNIKLGARANSAAQASKIENDVTLDVKNTYDTETRTDTASTFDAGWEIVKTTSDGTTPLKGAYFDLAVRIPASTESTTSIDKRNALLNNFYQGKTADGTKLVYDRANAADTDDTTNPWLNMFYQAAISDQFTGSDSADLDTYKIVNDDTLTDAQKKSQIEALAYDSVVGSDDDLTLALANGSGHLHDRLISMMRASDYEADGQGVLYFMHKDADTGAYMPSMDMESGDPVIMGDVIWTPVAAWATTHITGTDGYIQYCGLAAGDYALIERQAPAGYTMLSSTATLAPSSGIGGTTFQHAVKFTLGMPNTTLTDGSPASGIINGTPDTSGVNKDMVIENYEKSIFPLTGGIGIFAFIMAGLALMGAAIWKRKKDLTRQ